MPPAQVDDNDENISASEDDGPDAVPANTKIPTTKDDEDDEDMEGAAEEEGDEDDGEGAEDEFRVEKILDHKWSDKGLVYRIKWFGWDKKSDLTWEPVENLDGAPELLKQYHKKIGGDPAEQGDPSGGKKGGKRTASDAFADSPASKKKGRRSNGVADDTPPARKDRKLPIGSWEEHVTRVVSILENEDAKVEDVKGHPPKELIGLLEWDDEGPKTQHKLKVLRQKCPQRLLDYYEQHLVFSILEDVEED